MVYVKEDHKTMGVKNWKQKGMVKWSRIVEEAKTHIRWRVRGRRGIDEPGMSTNWKKVSKIILEGYF